MTDAVLVEPEPTYTCVAIRCSGDLIIEGWEQSVIEAAGQGGRPKVDSGPDQVAIEADSSCRVRIPRACELVKVAGADSLKVSNLRGVVELAEAGGDILVDGAGGLKLKDAAGRVSVARISGALQVTGVAKGDLNAHEVDGKISIAAVTGRLTMRDVAAVRVNRARGDVTVHNASANVVVRKAHGIVRLEKIDGAAALEKTLGDVSLRAVDGNVACDWVNGQLQLVDVGEVAIKQVKSDLSAENVRGSLSCQKANGSAALRDVGGSILFAGVGGDLIVDGCGGSVAASCGGAAQISEIQGNVRVNAGGDISVCPPTGVGAAVKAVCGGSLTIEGGATSMVRGPGIHSFKIGAGRRKYSYSLISGGGVHLSSVAQLEGPEEDPGTRGRQAAARARRHVARSLGRTIRHNLRAAGKRAAAGSWDDARSWSFRFESDPAETGAAARREQSQPACDDGRGFDANLDVQLDAAIDVALENGPGDEPVSDEERLTVLRLLEDGKITAVEAERLLNALDGRASGA